jgi:hypothetical protein
MSNYQPTGKHYEVKTIEELAAIVTPENLDLIMTDLRSTFETVHKLNDLTKMACDIQGIPHEKVNMEVFNWIDDGKHEVQMIRFEANDDRSINFELRADTLDTIKPEGKKHATKI